MQINFKWIEKMTSFFREVREDIKMMEMKIEQLNRLLEYAIFKSDITGDYYLWKNVDDCFACIWNSYSLVVNDHGKFFLRLDYINEDSWLDFYVDENEKGDWDFFLKIEKTKYIMAKYGIYWPIGFNDFKFSTDVENWLYDINHRYECSIYNEIDRKEREIDRLKKSIE